VDGNAFARTRSYLNFAQSAKWTAILSGAFASIFYVVLLILLALFADLLITRGRIPTFSELAISEQLDFNSQWKNLSDSDRELAIQQLGFSDFAASTPEESKKLSVEDRRRYRDYLDLISKENLPPILGEASEQAWQEWAAIRGITDNITFRATREQELRWRAYLWLFLKDHVGASAANSFQPAFKPKEPIPYSLLNGVPDRSGYGILSTIIHQRDSISGKLLSFLASWNSWMWPSDPNTEGNQSYLTGLLVVGALVIVLRTIFIVLMNFSAARATLEAVTRLRRAIYHQTSRLGNLALRPTSMSETNGLFTRHVEAIHDALNAWLTYGFRFPIQFFLCLIVGFLAHPMLAVIFFLFTILVWVVGGQLTAGFRRHTRKASRTAANQSALLLESLKLMRLVKAYLMELFNQSRVERQLADYSKAHLQRYRGESLARPIFVGLAMFGTITLLYLAGRIILADQTGLVNLFLLIIAFLSLYYPIQARFEYRKYMRRGRESAAIIFEFLEKKGDVAQFADAEFLQPMSKSLEFLDVSIREPGTSRVLLEEISFKINAGEKVCILGVEEDQKLALVYLIPRFFDPTSGEVRIDGRNLKWVTNDSLRAQIGLVLQNSLTFNDTVANNIGCGDTSYTLPQIIEASKLAHAHQVVMKLPYGYETPIGELGHSLRGGEQFRIALARAILRDPALVLIEEPVESYDDDTTALVDDALDRFLGDRTVIFLSHRTSTLKKCDRIILLNDGRIQAIGSHRDLYKSHPLYRRLYAMEYEEVSPG
jgi:ATP-binding cassette, subfamily B, bacterial